MKKRNLFLIICLIIGICSIFIGSVAYYRIVVSGNIKANTGNAVFVLKDSNNSVWENKVISLKDGNMVNPGDSGSFSVTMDASGSDVDMYATLEIDRGTLPTNLKFYTTSDKKSELHKYYSFLETNSPSETLTIYWYWNPYIDDLEDNKFINQSSLEATIKVSAVQISEYATMKNGSNFTFNDYFVIIDDNSTEFWSDIYNGYIRTITFDNDLNNLPTSCTEENLCWDISESSNQKKKVYGYLVDSGLKDHVYNTKPLYDLYIVSEAPIFAPSDCANIFRSGVSRNGSSYSNLVSINFNNNFNTSNVTNMESMFYNCDSLTELDITGFNTSKVLTMQEMFTDCSSLISLDLSNFNTSKVTDMSDMFKSCSNLTTNINIMNGDVTSYSNMFNGAATESGTQITVNYIAGASTLVDRMIATKSSNSNIVKGNIMTEYTITISGNDDITYESNNRAKGTNVTLLSISGNNWVTSFKMNGKLIEGNTFEMPASNVTITEITTIECTIFETTHYPYADSQNNVVIGEKTFEGATSLTVVLDYELYGETGEINEYFYIYDSASSTEGINNNKKYGGFPRTKETITINGNYIKITFTSSEYATEINFYGLKATIIPNY